jgi:hypothetical protein
VRVHFIAEACLRAAATDHLLQPRLPERSLAGNPERRRHAFSMTIAQA